MLSVGSSQSSAAPMMKKNCSENEKLLSKHFYNSGDNVSVSPAMPSVPSLRSGLSTSKVP